MPRDLDHLRVIAAPARADALASLTNHFRRFCHLLTNFPSDTSESGKWDFILSAWPPAISTCSPRRGSNSEQPHSNEDEFVAASKER